MQAKRAGRKIQLSAFVVTYLGLSRYCKRTPADHCLKVTLIVVLDGLNSSSKPNASKKSLTRFLLEMLNGVTKVAMLILKFQPVTIHPNLQYVA